MSKKVLLEGRTKIRWGRLAGIKTDAEARDEERRLRNRLFEGRGMGAGGESMQRHLDAYGEEEFGAAYPGVADEPGLPSPAGIAPGEELPGEYGDLYAGEDSEAEDLYEMMYEEEDEMLDDEDMGPDVEGGDETAMAPMDHEEPDADQMGGPSDMDADNMGGGAAGNEALAAELAVAVAGAIEDVLGVAVDVDSDVDMDDEGMDDMGGEEEMEMGDEEPMGDMGEEEPMDDMGGEEEELAESRRARRVAREVVRLLMKK